MTAVDYDDPNEGTNAQLKYTIEQSPMNDERQRIFKIDPMTGVIKTAVCCLDRETTPEYIIKVVAEDGGGRKGSSPAVDHLILDLPDFHDYSLSSKFQAPAPLPSKLTTSTTCHPSSRRKTGTPRSRKRRAT